MTGAGSCGITSTMSRIRFDLLDHVYKPRIPLFGTVGNFWDHGQWVAQQTHKCTIPSDGGVVCAGGVVQEAGDSWWRSQVKLAKGVKTTEKLGILIDHFHGLTGLFCWEFYQLFPQTAQGMPHTFPHSSFVLLYQEISCLARTKKGKRMYYLGVVFCC